MASPTASERTRRIVAMLGKFKEGARIPLADLATEMGTTPSELASDLRTLCLCGVAPYYPNQMVDVFVEDGVVEVLAPLPAVRGPVRLSVAEAEALAAALAVVGFTPDDPLTTKFMKSSSTAFDAEELERTLRPGIVGHDPALFEALASAVRAREALVIAYRRGGVEEPVPRTVEPLQLFADRGVWYLWAWCRQAGDYRTFRIDRIRDIEQTGERFDADHIGRTVAPSTALLAEGLPLARLRFTDGEPFVEREWPGGKVSEEGGTDRSVIADVPYAGTDWISRHVAARLGAVEVLEPAEVRAAVAALAEAELLRLSKAART